MRRGAERTRAALDALLKHVLPPAQQWSGNRAHLLDLALTLLSRDDRLVYLVPARLEARGRGVAAVVVGALHLGGDSAPGRRSSCLVLRPRL